MAFLLTRVSKRIALVLGVCLAMVATVAIPAADASEGPSDYFVVPASSEDIGSAVNAGAVTLLVTSPLGVPAPCGCATVSFHQSTAGVPGASEAGDFWGWATAWGDLDGNGTDDLIVGAPFEDVGLVSRTGAITVLYDAAQGAFTSAATFHQGSPGVPGANEYDDRWGTALDSGDVNGDGFDDVIVGAPNEDIGPIQNAGAITVLFGSASGLTGQGAQAFHQGSPGVPGGNEVFDRFGESVAYAGSASTGFYVAVGSPGETLNGFFAAGAVTIFEIGLGGLTPATPMLYSGASASGVRPNMPGNLQHSAEFGADLAGSPDGSLAIGAAQADVNGISNAGHVTVYRKVNAAVQAQLITQDHQGSGTVGPQHRFGSAVDFATINGTVTLAVGAPGTVVGGHSSAGSVTVIPTGGTATSFSQDSPGVPGAAEAGDFMGRYVDLSSSGALFAGTPGEDLGSTPDTGAGIMFFGTSQNIGQSAIDFVHQDTPGIPGINETNDLWGG